MKEKVNRKYVFFQSSLYLLVLNCIRAYKADPQASTNLKMSTTQQGKAWYTVVVQYVA